MLRNWCFWTVVLEKTLESPLDCKEIKPVSPKGNQSRIFIGRTDTQTEDTQYFGPWCEELTHWKRPWCWERLKAGGEGDDRGWDSWMASPTRWAGKPGMLQSMRSQRVRHNWATELKKLNSKIDCGDGCTTLWIYCKPLYTLNGELYGVWLLSQ